MLVLVLMFCVVLVLVLVLRLHAARSTHPKELCLFTSSRCDEDKEQQQRHLQLVAEQHCSANTNSATKRLLGAPKVDWEQLILELVLDHGFMVTRAIAVCMVTALVKQHSNSNSFQICLVSKKAPPRLLPPPPPPVLLPPAYLPLCCNSLSSRRCVRAIVSICACTA